MVSTEFRSPIQHTSLLTGMTSEIGSIQVIVVESVPPGGPMGTANGLAQMASSGSRTVAPTLATSLFALSLQRNLAGGNLVYYFFLGLTLVGIYGTSFLPPDKPRRGVVEARESQN